jgi:hypothetical protein
MPTKAGDTAKSLAATGAMTGSVSKAMETMAWMNKVAISGSQLPMSIRKC